MGPAQKSVAQDSSKRANGTNTTLHGGTVAASPDAERAVAFHSATLDRLGTSPLPTHSTTTSDASRPAISAGPSVPLPLLQKRSSYAPSISSPLNPAAASSSDDIASSDGQRRGSDGSTSSSSGSNPTSKIKNPRRRPPPPPVSRAVFMRPNLNRSSTSNLALPVGPDVERLGSPMTIHDLGSDYTRYFNPFSDSRRSSFMEGATSPLARFQSDARAFTPSGISNPFLTPNTSTTKVDSAFSGEKHAYFIDDRLAAPFDEKGISLFTDLPEDDDDMHLPHPDDDVRYKAKWSDHFSRENIVSTVGMIFMILGLLFVFVALPVLSYAGFIHYDTNQTPLDQMWHLNPPGEAWARVNNNTYPLLKNIRRGLIDPDTPKSAMNKTGINHDDYVLVFSDEFSDNNRTFYPGDDPYWFAPDIWYGATKDLDWYDPDAVTTWNGTLELRLDRFNNHNLLYRSGMLNSWNQLCFKGGIFEVSVSLPGPAAVMGLWPGVWSMGNLGRPGYLSTTEGLWPYTYNTCDVGITPNQSQTDGLSYLPGQRLPSCTCPGEDHPTPGTGRGAPEIDIFEAGASYGGLPIITQSYQVAPFDPWWYGDYEYMAYPDYSISYPNGYVGGPYQQALSATTNLNKQWYDGNAYQTYSFEYVPGEGPKAYIAWKVGDQMTWMFDQRTVRPNGNVGSRPISQEPMSIVLNLGFSTAWTEIMYQKLVFPTVMRVDYVRWYQKKGNVSVTCDPPGYETTQYIKDHLDAYTNPNFTKWEEAGYNWPKHKLDTNC